MDNQNSQLAIIREVADSFTQAVTMTDHKPIDVALARRQHQAYCDILVKLGLEVIRIPADDSLPDCCFPEDPAIVVEDIAIICNMAAPSRVPEITELEKVLSKYKKIEHIKAPGTIDGGDVMKIDKKLFIGVSARTNKEGIEQTASIVNPLGYEVIPVPIWNTLHLKSVCTHVGGNHIIVAEGFCELDALTDYQKIMVPKDEAYCANVLNINNKVLIPTGYPKTRSLIEEAGFSVVELDMSEFEKADGALTCLSKIL